MDPRLWRKFGGGGFPQKSLSFNMAHLAVNETGIHTTDGLDTALYKNYIYLYVKDHHTRPSYISCNLGNSTDPVGAA